MARARWGTKSTSAARARDVALVLLAAPLLAPVILVVAIVLLCVQGRPVFFISERMRSPEKGFRLVKFRTMRSDPGDRGVSGGPKAPRITPLGIFLRRSHLDELPQLWNVLRGDMSLVGPRPPLREVVERCPDVYREVLSVPPGVTGLASHCFGRREARILAGCRTQAETDAVYDRLCIPPKARLDAIYAQKRTPALDLALIVVTLVGHRG